MKKQLKRVLSMVLAMVMVMSVLPMNVFAVEMLDGADDVGQAEVPVLEPGDFAGLQGDISFSGEEQPEIPPDPSNEPGDLTWTNGEVSATINSDGSWTVTMSTNDAVADTSSMDWGVALIPNVKRGTETALPLDIVTASDFNGKTISVFGDVSDAITGGAGLTLGEFVCVGGSDIRTDASGNFTVSSTEHGDIPKLDDLLKEVGAAFPIDMVVVFFTKGSGAEQADGGVGTHVKYTTAKYGTAAAGIPSTTYTLNKSNNKLTFNYGVMGGQSWPPADTTPAGLEGTWDGTATVKVPLYNTLKNQGVIATIGTISAPSGVTPGADNEVGDKLTIDGNAAGDAHSILEFSIPDDVTSGTITVPITACLNEAGLEGDAIPGATITIKIINSDVNPVTFEIDYGTTAVQTPQKVEPADPDGGLYGFTDGDLNEDYCYPTAISDETLGIGFESGDEWTWNDGGGEGDDYQVQTVIPGTAAGTTNAQITFDPTGGTGSYLSTLTVGEHSGITVTFDCLDVDGGGVKIIVPVTIKVNGGYAEFYDTDGNLVGTALSGAPNGPVSVNNTVPSSTNGWTKNPSGQGTKLTDAQIVYGGLDATEKYYMVKAVTTYKVTYQNAASTFPKIADAKMPSDSTAYTSGASVTVKAATDLAVGDEVEVTTGGKVYKFLGWDDGAGHVYKPNDKFNITANTTLTAKWEEVKYTVTFDSNVNGRDMTVSGTVADQGPLSVGDAVTLTGTLSDSKGHYQFVGWNKKTTDTVKLDSYKVTKADADTNHVITLYAVWEAITYDVEYADSATGPKYGEGSLKDATLPTETAKMKDAEVTVKAGPSGQVTDKTGLYYTFKEWKTSDATIADGKFKMPAKKVTLTASWDPVMLTVTYALDGGDPGTNAGTTSVQKGDDYTIDADDPTKEGYSFGGWKLTGTATTAAGTVLNGGGTVEGVMTDITLTAQWTDKPGEAQITLNKDASDKVGGQTVTISDGTNTYTATETGDGTGVYKTEKKVPAGSYNVLVNGTDTGVDVTVSNDATGSASVQYYTVSVKTDGHGEATVSTASDKRIGDASATANDATPATIIVQSGEDVTWAFGDPADYYKEKTWDSEDPADTADITTTINTSTGADAKTHTANFEKKTSKVKVVLRVDGSVASPGRAVSIEFNGETKSIASGSTEVTFNGVEQSATAYPIKAEGAAYGADVTVGNDTDGSTVTFEVDFATAEVKTAGNGDATVTIAKYGDLTADLTATTADPTTKTASVIGLKGQTAKWHNAAPADNYSFKTWDDETPADKDDQTATLAATKVTHTAYFEKTSYDTYLTLTMNGDYVTDSTDDWSGWQVTCGNGTDTVTVDYDATNNRWVAHGVPSTTTDAYSWTVTTPHTGDYSVADAGDGQTATQALYGLQTVDTDYDTAQATMEVNGKTGLTQAEVKLSDPVKLAVTAASGYAHASPYWKQGTASKGTVAEKSYTLTEAITADQTLTPTFTYTAKVKTVYGSGKTVTAPGKDVVLKAGAGGTDVTLASFDGEEDVSGLIPGVTYTVWVNGFETTYTVTGTTGVEVPLLKIKTAVAPSGATGTAYINIGSSASGKADSIYVPTGATTGGTNASIQLAAAATGYYKLADTVWTDGTFGNAADAATTLTLSGLADDLTVTANLELKTATLTVQFRVDGVAARPDGTWKVKVDGANEKTLGASDTKIEYTLDQGSTYTVTLTDSVPAFSETTTANLADAGATVYVDFYTVTAAVPTSDAHGDVKVELVADQGTAAGTATSATTDWDADPAVNSASIVVLTGSKVTWTPTADDNYDFHYWDTTTTDTNPEEYKEVAITAATTHTGHFHKTKYTATLDLTLDGTSVGATDDDVTAVTLVHKSGDATKNPDLTAQYNNTTKKWYVDNLPNANEYTWTVVTRSNTGVTADVTSTKPAADIDLFKVSVVTGDDIPTGSVAPYIKAAGTTTVVEPAGDITLGPDTQNGYTWTSWIPADDSAMPTGLSATETELTIGGAYAGTSGGITIKPTFTFEVPVELRYNKTDGDLVPGQTVKVVDGDGTEATVTGKATDDGTYVVSGMTPGTDYKVVVNGYESKLVLKDTMATASTDSKDAQKVILHKITAEAVPAAAGTPTVNGKTAAEKVCYVPDGAVIPATGATAVTVAVPNANDGYRWATRTGAGETLWSTEAETVAITVATATSTTITTKADASVTADIVVKAQAVKIWSVDVKNTSTDEASGALGRPEVAAGKGEIASSKTGSDYLANSVDDGENIKVSVTPEPGYTPVWKVTDKSGDPIMDAVEGGGTVERTVAADGTVLVDQDMIITVDWELTEYEVTVQINKNNVAVTDIVNEEGKDPVLYLVKKNTTDKIPLTHKANGAYTARVVPGEYAIYSPVATPVDTGRAIKFDIQDGEKANGVAGATGTAANLTKTLNYYTVTIDKKFSDDPADDDKPGNVFAGHGSSAPANGTAETAAKTRTVLAGEGGNTTSVAIAASADNHSAVSGPYYSFGEWQENGTKLLNPGSKGNYTMPGENTWTADDNVTGKGITLTAVYAREYKVTLAAPGAAGTAAAPTMGVGAALDGTTRYSTNTNRTFYVTKAATGDTVLTVGAPALIDTTEAQNHLFSAWTATADTGSFNDDQTEFTLTGDTTLTPLYYKKPTLSGRQSHHLNFAVDYVFQMGEKPSGFGGNANNSLPVYTWTANDATIGDVKITLSSGDVTLVKDQDYTYDAGTGAITIKRSYLEGLEGSKTGTEYKVTVESKTPAGKTDTSRDAKLAIYVTPDQLLSVTIKVNANQPDTDPAKPYGTLNLTEGGKEGQTGRKTAIYASHTKASIIRENVLEFTWYYGEKPTKGDGTEHYEDIGDPASGGVAAKARAVSVVTGTYGGQLLDGATQADLTERFLADGTFPNAVLKNDNLKGKYIYAVVEASVTGYGAVITNSIPVDYDAAIKVRKDNSDAITSANYKVWLWDTDNEGDFTTAKAVGTTYDDTNKVYVTGASKLTGGKTYQVYVNKVEGDVGDTAYYVPVSGLTVKTQVDAAATDKFIDFYSVNAVENITPNHGKDSGSQSVGEVFVGEGITPAPIPEFTTDKTGGGTIGVTSGNGVLKGSNIVAKPNGSWNQDYHVDWKHGNSATLDFTTEANNTVQTKENALNTGYDKVKNIAVPTYVGIRLDQNLYTVTGNVWTKGWTSGNNAGITAATLKFVNGDDTYTFNANITGGGVTNKGAVTFTGVPRSNGVTGSAITGKYVISATEKTNPKTTILGYFKGQNVSALTNNAAGDAAVEAATLTTAQTLENHVEDDTTQAFIVEVASSTYKLTLTEDTVTAEGENEGPTTEPGPATAATAIGTRAFAEVYAARKDEATTYTVTLTNAGNTDLKVSLNIKKGAAYVYGGEATDGASGNLTPVEGSADNEYSDANGMVFGKLTESFELDAGESATFTVTIPSPLAVDDAANYDFEFTSIQKGTDADGATTVYGPSVTYKLTETVTPRKITYIEAKAQDGSDDTFVPNPDKLTIEGITQGATNITAQGISLNDEVEYTWWKGPYDDSLDADKVEEAFNRADGTFKAEKGYSKAAGAAADGSSYKYNEADQGMAIYIVAKNKNTGNIIEAAYNFPTHVNVPYDLKVQINEDGDPVKGANAGRYKLYLVPEDKVTAADADFATALAGGNGIITGAAPASTDDSGQWSVTGLIPGTVYHVYTNAVGGTTDKHIQDSGVTVSLDDFGTKADGSAKDVKVVDYYSLTVDNTATVNTPYTIAASDDVFLNDTNATTPITVTDGDTTRLVKPIASFGAGADKVAVADATKDGSKFVQKNTTVDLSYSNWARDYKLEWTSTNGSDKKDTAPADDAPATSAVTMGAAKTVGTTLTLNTARVTVYVSGSGSLKEITIKDTKGHTFTTGADAAASGGSDMKLHATASNPAANATMIGQGTYYFTVPKGTGYKVKGTINTGTTLKYYNLPASDTTEIPDEGTGSIDGKTMDVADDTSDFRIVLDAVGQFMLVEDDQTTADDHKPGNASVQGTAVSDPDTAGTTIHVPFGNTGKDVVVTIQNNSGPGTDNTLFNVKWTPDTEHNSDKITPKDTELAALDGNQDIEAKADASDPGPKKTLTLTVDAGLDVDTYVYTADVTFNSVNDTVGEKTPTVTYTLTVVVDPTEFKAVTVVGDNGTAATGMLPLGEGLKFETYTTEEFDDWNTTTTPNGPTNLQETDYAYQWYYGKVTDPTVSWDEDTAAVTVSDGLTAITDANTANLAASEIAKHPGQNFYLVIYALTDKNVIGAAISDPVTTGYQPVVKIKVDGVDQSTVEGFDGTGYAVILNDTAKDYKTVWSDDADGFVPVNDADQPISLPGTASLTAKVAPAKGITDAAKLTALTGVTLDLDHRSANAPYFTVNAVATRAFEAIDGQGETFDAMPEMQFALGTDDLADQTPVLQNQNVTAKIKAAWTQDYDLTWYTATAAEADIATTAAPDPDVNAYVKPDSGSQTMTEKTDAKGQDKTAATAANASGNIQVTGKTWIGGKLEQITYEVTGTVKSPDSASANVTEVTLTRVKEADTDPTYSSKFPGGTHMSDTHTVDGQLRHDQTVTFTVVKGKYTIGATPGASTVITSMQWESETEVKDGAPLENKDVSADHDFVINLVGSDVRFSVTDGTVTGESPDGHGDNEVTRYFSHIGKDHVNIANPEPATSYDLTLTNPGNKDLKMSLDVFHYATMPEAATFDDPDNFLDADKVYPTDDLSGNKAEIKLAEDGPVVLTLGSDAKPMLTNGTKLLKNNGTDDGTLPAGTLILGADARAKDTGVFVFRFKGETDVNTETQYAYYVLDLTIDQLPIKTVATNNDGSTMVGKGDTIAAKGFSADPDTTPDTSLANVQVAVDDDGTLKTAADAKLTDADVKFAWVKVHMDKDTTPPTTATLGSYFQLDDDGALTSKKTDYAVINADKKDYTLVDGDENYNFYLVAYAPNPATEPLKTNACDMAISGVVKAKRTAGVIVKLDNNQQPLLAPYADPGYIVFLVEKGGTLAATVTKNEDGSYATAVTGAGTWATTWNAATKRYEAAIDVDNTTYEVYALTYKGGTTVVKAIEDTLGKQDGGADPKFEQTVPYWSVKHTANVAVENTHNGYKSYLPGGVATNDNALQNALSVTVSNDKGSINYTDPLTAANVPVLEGMNVKVTVDTTKKNNNATTKEAWSDKADYHTLTTNDWTDAATGKTSAIAYPAGDAVSSADTGIAVAAGIQNKTFSAKLEQVLFTVKFTVKDVTDPTPSSNTAIGKVTLSPDHSDGKEPATATDTISVTGKWGHDAEVTLTGVPAGDLTVKADIYTGTSTIVKSYAWNAAEGDLVQVTTDTATNEDTEDGGTKDNLINIVEAAKAVTWLDDFDYTDGGNLEEITNDKGLRKVDLGGAQPDLSLTKGYKAEDGDILTYRVKLTNTGNEPLNGFFISGPDNANWTAHLDEATYHDKDGNDTVRDAGTFANRFTLRVNEYVTFTIDIPEGQAASGDNYSSLFQVKFTEDKPNEQLAGQEYKPEYQVKGDVQVDNDGTAEIYYGDTKFDGTATQIAVSGGFTGQRFHYEIMTEAEVADYLGDGVTPEAIVRYDLPGWLAMGEDTGAFSVTAAAKGVHVKEDPADSELKVYVKITSDDDSRLEKVATFTLNIKTTQLSIFTGITTEGTWENNTDAHKNDEGAAYKTGYVGAYGTGGTAPDPTKVDGDSASGKIIHGGTVEKDFFQFTKVASVANTADEVISTGTHDAGDAFAMGTWSVTPTSFNGIGADDENAGEYTLKFTYTGTGDTDKYDYVGHEIVLAIPVQKPAQDLNFADEIATAGKVVVGTYTKQDGTDMTGLNGDVPVKLDYTTETKRLGDQITYLDTDPSYTVKLRQIGDIYGLELKLDPDYETKGFKATLPAELTFDEDGILTFPVKLTNMAGGDTGGLWAGEHKIKLIATGYSSAELAEAHGDPDVTASYELTLKVLPKVITKLDVKVTDPKTAPDAVKGKLEGDAPDADDRDLTQKDGKGNTPVDPDGTKATWTPGPDGKNTGVEVTVEIDPNYIYAEDDPTTDPDNEDITKHTALTVTDKPNDPGEMTVKRDEGEGSDPEHIVHIKQTIPYLMHDDVKAGDATDKTGPKVDDTRTVSGFTTDDTDLGKYEIHVGSYPVGATFGKVYDLKWSVETDELTAVGAKLLNAAGETMDFTALTPEDFTASGDKYTLTLDMSAMNFPAAKTYTLALKAVGAATDGGEKNIASTYTIKVVVAAPTPGYLTFDDAKRGSETDKLGPDVDVERTVEKNKAIRIPKGTKPEQMGQYIYDVNLNAADHLVYGVTVSIADPVPAGWSITEKTSGDAAVYPETVGDLALLTPHSYVLDLTGLDTSTDKKETVKLIAKGYSTKEKALAGGEPDVTATYTVDVVVYTPSTGGGGGGVTCPHQVSYLLGLYGTTTDPVMDMVADKAKPSKTPEVTPVEGWKFLGWSMTAPTGNASKDAERELVVPKDVSITGDTNFYAVYAPAYDLGRPFHEHYVIGYPNGNFGPADNINRASVATIIARAVLPNFVEGADYGNPGGYTDVADHWAASAIAYCSKYGVFNGYEDGTFRPDQSITRQEFALVMARLDGVLTAGNMPFNDIDEAGDWALGGIYTAYIKGWVNGYTDGSFKPLAYIQRDEAVKILNAYLYRGVDEAGLADLKEYIHSGVASNNTENGTDEYMTWPDVPKGHWAYYEIIEAANDHEYTVDETQPKGYTVPEHWDKCWIDERWRYHDDLNDGGPTVGLVRTGFRVWTEA